MIRIRAQTMIFRRTEPSHDYRSLRFLSDTGIWELGLSPYQYGIRLRMGFSGRPPSVIDFCLGHDATIYSPALLAVMKLLEQVPESASEKEIDALFPWAGTRPDPSVHLKALLEPYTVQNDLVNPQSPDPLNWRRDLFDKRISYSKHS